MSKLELDDVAGDVDDNDFFNVLEGRKSLHDLFSAERLDVANETLKYQNPRPQKSDQPAIKVDVPPPVTPAAATISTAKTQQKWQTRQALVAKAYQDERLIGNVGVALLADDDNNLKIVLYKTKSQILGALELRPTDECIQLRKKSQYVQFHDKTNCYWSLAFTEHDERLLAQQLKEFGIQIIEEEDVTQKSKEIDTAAIKSLDEIIVAELCEAIQLHEDVPSDSSDDKNSAAHSRTAIVTRIAKLGQPLPFLNTSLQTSTPNSFYNEAAGAVTIPDQIPVNASSTSFQASEPQFVNQYNFPLEPENINPAGIPYLGKFRREFHDLRMVVARMEDNLKIVIKRLDYMEHLSDKSNAEQKITNLTEKCLMLRKENRELKNELELRPTETIDQLKNESAGCSFEYICAVYPKVLASIGIPITKDHDMETLFDDLVQRSLYLHRGLEKRNIDLAETRERYQALQTAHDFTKDKMTELEMSNKTLKSELDACKSATKTMEEKQDAITETQLANARKAKTEKEADLKSIMNCLYDNMAKEIECLHSTEKSKVLSILGTCIRDATYLFIEPILKQPKS